MSINISKNFNTDYFIREHFISKRSINNISSKTGVPCSEIVDIIESTGRVVFNLHLWTEGAIALKICIALYNSGVGLRGIEKRVGISVCRIRSELIRQGVRIRTQSEQEICKWKLMDSSTRSKQVSAAHKATKGRHISREELIKRANTKETTKKIRTSPYESRLIDLLYMFDITTQKAVGIYNVDFVINGHIAVEVLGGKWHRFGAHADRHIKRSKEIFDSGYSLIFVHVDKFTDMSLVSEKIITLCKSVDWDKTVAGQHWVIWGALDLITAGGIDDIDSAIVSPTRNVRNAITGRYDSVAK